MLQRLIKWVKGNFTRRIPGSELMSQTPAANLPGVIVLSCRDAMALIEAAFKIERGREVEAVESLLRVLDANGKFSLADPRRDAEGAIIFRSLGEHLQTKSGGHGWSSPWEDVGFEAAVHAALEVVEYNRGDSFHAHGYFSQYKVGRCPWGRIKGRE